MKKLWKEQRGETLVEALCAILIIALSILFLTNASVSAGRINKLNAERDSSFHHSSTAAGSLSVTVKSEAGATVCVLDANLYETEPKSEADLYIYRYYR